MDNKTEIQLVKGVRAKIRHSTPVKEGVEVWRVIINFISDIPEPNRIIKEYFVWVTGEFLEDKAKLSPDIQSSRKFALDIAQKRFKESGKQVPIENGISCSVKDGVIIVNPKEYVHPAEK